MKNNREKRTPDPKKDLKKYLNLALNRIKVSNGEDYFFKKDKKKIVKSIMKQLHFKTVVYYHEKPKKILFKLEDKFEQEFKIVKSGELTKKEYLELLMDILIWSATMRTYRSLEDVCGDINAPHLINYNLRTSCKYEIIKTKITFTLFKNGIPVKQKTISDIGDITKVVNYLKD
jgi:hypothetical protein